MANKVTTVFEAETKSFRSGMKNLISDVKDAEGFTGKLKAGASGLSGVLKDNLAGAAIAAGTAIVAFGVKAGQAFRDTALDAGRFSDATGLAVEDASRWIEVAGDLGIQAGDVQSAIQKMNKGIADGKPVFSDLGDVVVKTKNGLVDANATFIQTIDAISRIKDPTERAQAAQDAFGRGYASMAELTKMSAEQLRSKLAEVSDQKVIDDGELSKAKTWRERWDNLKDTFEDVQLAVGSLVTSLSPLIAGVADVSASIVKTVAQAADWVFATGKMSDAAKDFWQSVGDPKSLSRGEAIKQFASTVAEALQDTSRFDKWKAGFVALGGAFTDASDDSARLAFRFGVLKDQFEKLGSTSPEVAQQMLSDFGKLLNSSDENSAAFREWAASVGLTNDSLAELGDAATAGAAAAQELADATDEAAGNNSYFNRIVDDFNRGTGKKFKDLLEDQADAIAAADAQLQILKGHIDERQAWRNMQDALTDLQDKIASGTASWSELADASDKAALATADVISQMEQVPPEVKSSLYVALDQGNLDGVMSFISTAQKGFKMPIYPEIKGKIAYSGVTGGQMIVAPVGAEGGIVTKPTLAMIGEAGPEAVVPLGKLNEQPGASPLPSGNASSRYGDTFNINITTLSDARSNLDVIERYRRRGGRTAR